MKSDNDLQKTMKHLMTRLWETETKQKFLESRMMDLEHQFYLQYEDLKQLQSISDQQEQFIAQLIDIIGSTNKKVMELIERTPHTDSFRASNANRIQLL